MYQIFIVAKDLKKDGGISVTLWPKYREKLDTCTDCADYEVFEAETFNEVATKSKNHGMQMFMKKDPAHMEAMQKMQDLMKDPDAMAKWMDEKKKEFEAKPDE